MTALFGKLFNQKIGPKRMITSILGFIIGLSITLIACESIIKINSVLNNAKDANYLIINKKINLFSNTLFNKKPSFSDKEIKSLANQSFTKKVAAITSSQYKIRATSKSLNFSTDLFFESVPNDMIDVYSYKFRWREDDEIVPIIIPREFLHLYNFGFAQSQGTRTIPASLVKTITVNLRLRNDKGGEKHYKAKIVGLSDRLPTILAPQSFNEYINNNFANKKHPKTTRLLISVTNPSDPHFLKYLKKNHYEANNDKLQSGKVALIVNILSGILLFFGLIFILLSIVNIMLTFNLIITKSQEDIKLLLEIGYTPKHITQYFYKYLSIILLTQAVCSIVTFLIINHYMSSKLTSLGYNTHSYISIVTIAILIFISLGTAYKFRSEIKKIINQFYLEK